MGFLGEDGERCGPSDAEGGGGVHGSGGKASEEGFGPLSSRPVIQGQEFERERECDESVESRIRFEQQARLQAAEERLKCRVATDLNRQLE